MINISWFYDFIMPSVTREYKDPTNIGTSYLTADVKSYKDQK